MSPPVIRVWSDFVCPWCYVGLAALSRLHERFDFEVDWRPFLLRPETPPEGLPLPPHIAQSIKDPNHPLKLRARAEGLEMRFDRTLIPSTRRAHEGAAFAREHSKLDAFHAAVLRSYWTRSEDLWELSTLRAAATEAGLDPEALAAAIEAGTYRARVEEELAQARQLGVSAVPTFLIGDAYVIQGAQDVQVFAQALERLGHAPRPH